MRSGGDSASGAVWVTPITAGGGKFPKIIPLKYGSERWGFNSPTPRQFHIQKIAELGGSLDAENVCGLDGQGVIGSASDLARYVASQHENLRRNNTMSNQPAFLPDLANFPDCEEKRRVENLGQKIGLLIREQAENRKDFAKVKELHNQLNETWWEANTCMGALIAKTINENKSDRRWRISMWMSIVALFISLCSLAVAFLKP